MEIPWEPGIIANRLQLGGPKPMKLTCISFLFLLVPLLPAEVREFESSKGQIIKAEPVVMRGMNVILRMENKQQVPVPVKNFSVADQAWIQQWMRWDPTALDYNFDCKPVEKAGEAMRQKLTYYRYEVVPRGFEVQICNRSQSTLEGVKVAYRVFLEDRVGKLGEVHIKVNYHTGVSELPVLKTNVSHTLITKKLECEKLTPVDGWTFYVGKITRDRLRGVWLRFYRHGTMVSEWKSSGVPKCAWPESKDEMKQMEKDKEAARKGAEAAATSPDPTPKPEPAGPVAKPAPLQLPKKEDEGGIPEELKIFELE